MSDIDDFTVETSTAAPAAPPAAETGGDNFDAAENSQETGPIDAPAETDGDGSLPAGDRNPDGTFKAKGERRDPASRIAKITWEREEAKREAARERAAREELAAQLEAARRNSSGDARQGEPGPAANTSAKPTVDQFSSYEDFVEALADWKAEQKFAQREHAEQSRRQETQAREMQTAFNTRLEAARGTIAGFDEALQNAREAPLSDTMMLAVIESQRGPEILHFLATHPEECIQLAEESKSDPRDAAKWMRRLLESKLSAQAAPSGPAPAATRSVVPPPIKPVGSGPVVADTPVNEIDDIDKYIDTANKKDGWRGRRFVSGR